MAAGASALPDGEIVLRRRLGLLGDRRGGEIRHTNSGDKKTLAFSM